MREIQLHVKRSCEILTKPKMSAVRLAQPESELNPILILAEVNNVQ